MGKKWMTDSVGAEHYCSKVLVLGTSLDPSHLKAAGRAQLHLKGEPDLSRFESAGNEIVNRRRHDLYKVKSGQVSHKK